MHAVVIKVKLPEGQTLEESRRQLESQVLPAVRQRPGIIAGYWMPQGTEGLSVLVFDTEENAKVAAAGITPPAPVQLVSAEVRPVAASL